MDQIEFSIYVQCTSQKGLCCFPKSLFLHKSKNMCLELINFLLQINAPHLRIPDVCVANHLGGYRQLPNLPGAGGQEMKGGLLLNLTIHIFKHSVEEKLWLSNPASQVWQKRGLCGVELDASSFDYNLVLIQWRCIFLLMYPHTSVSRGNNIIIELLKMGRYKLPST